MAASDRTAGRRTPGPRTGGQAAAATPKLRLKRLQAVAQLLACGGDPSRLRMILMLAGGEAHNAALCGAVGLTQPAVSHHLALLRHGRVVDASRRGRRVSYLLTESGRALARAAEAFLP